MASNMYLKFENPDVAGTSTTPGHEREIEVLSWSHGFVQMTTPVRVAQGHETEYAQHSNFNFTKYVDASTNTLLKYCWSGRQFKKATLSCYRTDTGDKKPLLYLIVTMEHVVIAGYNASAGPGETLVENISLDYGIVTYDYKGQKSPDITPAKHDRIGNRVD
jgi:type VI secretion system secreted protein Hcp